MAHRRRPNGPPSRRELLAVAGAGLAPALAGCSALPGRVLESPEIEERSRTTIHNYYVDGERLAEVSFTDFSRPDSHRWRYPIRLNVWHGDGLRLERLEYTFRPRNHDHPPGLYLQRPDGYPWEPIEFSRGDDPETTVLSVPDLGFQGRGSVAFELLVDVSDDEPFDLRVDVEATFGSERLLGREYRLEDSIERTLPGQRALE